MLSVLLAAALVGNGPLINDQAAPATQAPPPLTTPAPAAPPQTAPAAKPDKDELRHQQDIKGDQELGKKIAVDADKEYKPSKDVEATARVQRIGAEMAQLANQYQTVASWGDKRMNRFDYTFKLVQGDDINAFSLPGGYIYVFDGLVKFVESDDELAGVLAHEISHAKFRHVAELQRRASQISTVQLPMILIAIMTGHTEAAGGLMTVGSLVSQAKGSGWSVEAEEAADYGGFQLMTKSKYDPTGMLSMMERLALQERNGAQIEMGIYRSHPPSRERAESLVKEMGQANLPIRRSKVCTSFRATVRPGEKGMIDLLFGKRRLTSFAGSDALTRADAAVDELNRFYDSTPELFEMRVADDGKVMGREELLFQLKNEDAVAAGTTVDKATADALKNMKLCLSSLGFRVWDTR